MRFPDTFAAKLETFDCVVMKEANVSKPSWLTLTPGEINIPGAIRCEGKLHARVII